MVRRQQAADRAVRPPMRSPGHPKFHREVEAAFWAQIGKGLLPVEAAAAIGVSQPVGQRWFSQAGGMPPFDIKKQPSGRFLSFAEREDIALLKAQNKGVREIARAVGRDPATISRELRRNAATRGGRPTTLHGVRRPRSSSPTRGCTPMSKSGCRGRSVGPTAPRSQGRSRRDGPGTTSRTARTGPGCGRGARSRSRTGSRSTSPMMSPCGSATR